VINFSERHHDLGKQRLPFRGLTRKPEALHRLPLLLVAAFVLGAATPAGAQSPAQPTDPAASAANSGASAAQPQPAPEKKPDPFAFADFTWLSGNPRTKESPLDTMAFTGEFRADVNFTYSFNKPVDDTIVGSSEIFRSGEFQPDLRKSENRVTFALLVKL
jgi:hypothetical protein